MTGSEAWRHGAGPLSAIGPGPTARDERVQAFLIRPLQGDWPFLWRDATRVKLREGGPIISLAVIVAVAVNEDGKREVQGTDHRRPRPPCRPERPARVLPQVHAPGPVGGGRPAAQARARS